MLIHNFIGKLDMGKVYHIEILKILKEAEHNRKIKECINDHFTDKINKFNLNNEEERKKFALAWKVWGKPIEIPWVVQKNRPEYIAQRVAELLKLITAEENAGEIIEFWFDDPQKRVG